MMLVQLDDVYKSYGGHDVLRGASFQVNAGDRLGLVGWNGAGKTTVLRLVTGLEEADKGRIAVSRGLRIGLLEQQPVLDNDRTVRDEALSVFSELRAIEEQMADLENAMAEASGPVLDQVMLSYSDLRHTYELSGGFTYNSQAEAVLGGLGFAGDDLSQSAARLSGGQKSRLALAKLLLAEPDLLLLDEPTNHLDMNAVEWLESFLAEYKSAFIIVSHDRFLLDRTVDKIVEIEGGRTTVYPGNYTTYVRQREEKRNVQARQFAEQQQMIARTEEFIRRNIAGQKTKQAKSRRKMLEKLDRVGAVQRSPAMKAGALKVEVARTGATVLTVSDLGIGYRQTSLVGGIVLTLYRGARLGIIGPNGSGKTTFLKTLSGGLEPITGELSWNVKAEIGYFDQESATLDANLSVWDELAETDADRTPEMLRSLLARFLFTGDDVFKPVSALSGGERSRLALAKLLMRRPNVLLLDEPTNHLDIPSREALESALADYAGTIVVVSHDRYFLDKIATELLHFENGSATHYLGTYSDYFERARVNEPDEKEQSVRTPPPRRNPGVPRRKLRGRPAAEIESEIGSLEAEMRELADKLAHPDSAWGPDQYAAIDARQTELSSRLDVLYSEWALADGASAE
jgi:ATP-binding cassette subfamily F protein 3